MSGTNLRAERREDPSHHSGIQVPPRARLLGNRPSWWDLGTITRVTRTVMPRRDLWTDQGRSVLLGGWSPWELESRGMALSTPLPPPRGLEQRAFCALSCYYGQKLHLTIHTASFGFPECCPQIVVVGVEPTSLVIVTNSAARCCCQDHDECYSWRIDLTSDSHNLTQRYV